MRQPPSSMPREHPGLERRVESQEPIPNSQNEVCVDVVPQSPRPPSTQTCRGPVARLAPTDYDTRARRPATCRATCFRLKWLSRYNVDDNVVTIFGPGGRSNQSPFILCQKSD